MRSGLIETGKFLGYCLGMLVMIPAGCVYKASKLLVEYCADFDKDSIYETED
jgi:hypothetical protein